MAAGEKVALTRRVHLNSDKSAAVDSDGPDAAWFLGGEGTIVDKDRAVALGLTEDDFGTIPNAMDAILAQERANRATITTSSAVVMQPNPSFQEIPNTRLAFDRNTGAPIDGHPDAEAAAQEQREMEAKQGQKPENKQMTMESAQAEGKATEETPPVAATSAQTGTATAAKK